MELTKTSQIRLEIREQRRKVGLAKPQIFKIGVVPFKNHRTFAIILAF